jgi:hypothetical protein
VSQKPHSNTSFGGVQTVHFPEAVEATYAIDKLMLRPFGINKRDLEVDFNQPFRPALVTDILECCTTTASGQSLDRDLLWSLTISTRIEWLLRIITMDGVFDTPLPVRCCNETCEQTSGVELSLAELLEIHNESDNFITVDCGSGKLQLRKPTGLDQCAWATGEFPTERAAIESMVQALVVRDNEQNESDVLALDDESLFAIDRLMQEEDALVNFSLEVICPCCESATKFDLDLQAFAIERLRQAQQRLLTMVHQFAKHYHWTEQEIFSVPVWRRIQYRKLIEKELA